MAINGRLDEGFSAQRLRSAEERQRAAAKSFVKIALAFALAFIVGMVAMTAYQERQQRRGRADLQPRALHPCQPPAAKVAEEWRKGRVIMDAKCDDSGGMFILTAPRK